MTTTIRPANTGQQLAHGPAIVATITLDCELTLAPPHPIHARVDTVIRSRDNLAILQGTPSANPIPVKLPDAAEHVAVINVGPLGHVIYPGNIRMLNVCCVCGTPKPDDRTFHENFEGRLFCWPCADGNRPTCPAREDCRGSSCEWKAQHGPRPDPLCDCHQPPAPISEHVTPQPADDEPAPAEPTVDQRDELLEAAARLGAEFAQVAQAFMPAVQAAADKLAQLGQALQAAGLLDADGKPARRQDRPAWQSPYGPKPRR